MASLNSTFEPTNLFHVPTFRATCIARHPLNARATLRNSRIPVHCTGVSGILSRTVWSWHPAQTISRPLSFCLLFLSIPRRLNPVAFLPVAGQVAVPAARLEVHGGRHGRGGRGRTPRGCALAGREPKGGLLYGCFRASLSGRPLGRCHGAEEIL